MSNASKLVGTFVGILALILLVSAAAPLLGASAPADTRTKHNASTFQPASNLVETPAENGSVSVDADTDGKVVVIDQAHQNAFSSSDIQPLVDSLVEAGHEVRFHGSAGQQIQSPDLNQSLRGADALVVIAPRRAYRSSEVRGVANFTERGGRVLMLAEPASTQISGGLLSLSVTEVSTQLTSLSSQFGMSAGTGYLYNMHDNANNFQHVYATPDGEANLTTGVEQTVFQRATPVTVRDSSAETLLTATDRTRLSSTRGNGTYAVAARNGNATLVGDSTFLQPSYYLDSDNEALLGNTLAFLVTGEKTEKQQPASSSSQFGGGNNFPQAPSGG